MNSLLDQKEFLIQRCRIVGRFALTDFFGRRGDVYCLDIHLDLHKGRREHE